MTVFVKYLTFYAITDHLGFMEENREYLSIYFISTEVALAAGR